MTYHVQLTPQALEDLSRLDAASAERIAAKIQWLAEHFDQIQPEKLTGPFANLFKLRVGDWRVLYAADSAQQTMTIHVIAHPPGWPPVSRGRPVLFSPEVFHQNVSRPSLSSA